MASITQDNKLKNHSQQESNSGITTSSRRSKQTFKKGQVSNNSNNTKEEQDKTTKTDKEEKANQSRLKRYTKAY